MNTQAQTLKEQEKEFKRTAIIDAAAELFSQKGFHDVKVDDIASKLGYAKGTIYLYFENKEKLFNAIIIERAKALYNNMEEVLQCKTNFEDCLRSFIRVYLEFFRDHAAFFKMMHSEKTRMNMKDHQELHRYGMESFRQFGTFLSKIMKLAENNGFKFQVDSSSAAKALGGILYAYIFSRIFGNNEGSLENEIEEIVIIFLYGTQQIIS